MTPQIIHRTIPSAFHKLVGIRFSSGTLTFCQMGVLNSCFQNPSSGSGFFLFSGVGKSSLLLRFSDNTFSGKWSDPIEIF